jgi:hypothetical protein
MLFEGGFTFANFLVDVFTVFMFVVWLWLLFLVFGDLFRRRDISGWAKAVCIRVMADRSVQQAHQARDELRRAVGFSVADEIEKLDRLQKSGSITTEEYARLRARLV